MESDGAGSVRRAARDEASGLRLGSFEALQKGLAEEGPNSFKTVGQGREAKLLERVAKLLGAVSPRGASEAREGFVPFNQFEAHLVHMILE